MAEPTISNQPETGPAACPHCGGSGWRILEREGVEGVERCECALAGRSKRIENAAGIPYRFAQKSLDNFKLPDDNPTARDQLMRVMRDVKHYQDNYPVLDKPGLLFSGGTGVGKTHLAVSAFRRLIARGFSGLFFGYQELLERIRKGWNPQSGTSDREAYQNAMDCEVLLLDDLGAHRAQDWMEDVIHGIISHRYNNGKTIIATTNLPDDDERVVDYLSAGNQPVYKKTLAEIIGSRSSSRLHEMCRVIRMPAVQDYRMKPR